MVDTRKVVRMDMTANGNIIVTLQDEHNRLEHIVEKDVPKELLEEYNGEVYNRLRQENQSC